MSDLKQRAELVRLLGRRWRSQLAGNLKATARKHKEKAERMLEHFAGIHMGQVEASRLGRGKALVKGMIAALRGDNDRAQGLMMRGVYEDAQKVAAGQPLEGVVTEEDVVEALEEETREKH